MRETSSLLPIAWIVSVMLSLSAAFFVQAAADNIMISAGVGFLLVPILMFIIVIIATYNINKTNDKKPTK